MGSGSASGGTGPQQQAQQMLPPGGIMSVLGGTGQQSMPNPMGSGGMGFGAVPQGGFVPGPRPPVMSSGFSPVTQGKPAPRPRIPIMNPRPDAMQGFPGVAGGTFQGKPAPGPRLPIMNPRPDAMLSTAGKTGAVPGMGIAAALPQKMVR